MKHQEYEQILSIIEMLNQITSAMQSGRISDEDIKNVQTTVEAVNSELYGVPKLKFEMQYDLVQEAYIAYIGELQALCQIWKESIQRRCVGKNIDQRFWNIYEKFKYVLPDDIYLEVMNRFMGLPEGQRIEYLSLRRRYDFLKNSIDVVENDYSLIIEHVEMMVQNVESFKWLYEHLEDYRSKYVLIGIIEYWFNFDLFQLHQLTETIYADYFDLDIVPGNSQDVFVDCGAFTGDTVRDFVNTYSEYKRIYAYELTPSTFQTLRNNVQDIHDIILRQKGVSSKNAELFVDDRANIAGNKILEQGDTKVEVVSLDNDINEEITIIKMDIEGAEKDALMGAKQHILSEKPKMMISSYHISSDIFEIPLLINSIRDDYKFYMRFNGHNGLWPCDYVLFAV